MTDTPRVLWYFADPMCSWCWGFAPVVSQIMETYRDRLQLALMMGGLRPGTTQSMSAPMRSEIVHHWEDVHRLSGQPFKFDGALPEGFVYDTEPACRAVVTLLDLKGEVAFAFFKSIQSAFYTEGKDVTKSEILAELAEVRGVAKDTFLERFESAEIRQRTREHFRQTAEIGIRGFPTVILQNGERFELLTHGYRPFEELKPLLEAWFAPNR